MRGRIWLKALVLGRPSVGTWAHVIKTIPKIPTCFRTMES